MNPLTEGNAKKSKGSDKKTIQKVVSCILFYLKTGGLITVRMLCFALLNAVLNQPLLCF